MIKINRWNKYRQVEPWSIYSKVWLEESLRLYMPYSRKYTLCTTSAQMLLSLCRTVCCRLTDPSNAAHRDILGHENCHTTTKKSISWLLIYKFSHKAWHMSMISKISPLFWLHGVSCSYPVLQSISRHLSRFYYILPLLLNAKKLDATHMLSSTENFQFPQEVDKYFI